MIDSGFKASEVYRFCLATGWKAFKGDDTEYFLDKDPATNRSVRRIWQRTFVDLFFGTRQARRLKPMPLFRWSNSATKDLLAECMMGVVRDWTLPTQIGRDYLKQVAAERREEKADTAGRIHYFWKQVRRDNHVIDCELMILVAAVITKLIAAKECAAALPRQDN